MGILSVTPIEKRSYKIDISTGYGTINTITVDKDGLYIVYYIKEGKTINRTGRITNIIMNTIYPTKSYILFDMSEDNSAIKERIHFCQIANIQDITEHNAYKIAVDHGFVGTLCDWLESMRGTPGYNAYQMAIENGYFEGTEEEWFLKYGEVGLIEQKKIDKVQDAKPGNLAAFGNDGNIYDSGIDASNPNKVKVFIGYNSINNAVKNCIPKANDICIVKTPINTETAKIPTTELEEIGDIVEPFEYTAYVYDGKHWRAMSGNYNASNVYIGCNLESRYSIGNFKVNNGELTKFATENMSLIDLWNAIFVAEPTEENPIDPDTKTGKLIIHSDIGSRIDYKLKDSDKNIDSFIMKEETFTVEVPYGIYTITRYVEVGKDIDDITIDIKSVDAIIEEEHTEYIADMKYVSEESTVNPPLIGEGEDEI